MQRIPTYLLCFLSAISLCPAAEVASGTRLDIDSEDAAVWWALSGASKIRPDQLAPQGSDSTIPLRAARNEREAVQIVVRPTRPLTNFRIRCSPLEHPQHEPIAAERIDLLRVGYVTVEHPTDDGGAPGPWPDPLLPISGPLDLDAGTNHAFWIRVSVPKGTPAGIYKGFIEMESDGFNARVPIELQVYDFTLPDRMTCVTAFGLYVERMARYHRLESDADKRRVYDLYLDNFAAHRVAPYDPALLDPIKVEWPDPTAIEAGSLEPRLDFTAWDRAMETALDERHFNAFLVSIPGMGGGTFHAIVQPELLGFAEDTPEYQALFSSYCRQLEAHLDERGWLDRSYTLWFDEPSPGQYPFVMAGFDKLKKHVPGVARVITDKITPELAGGPNIWCPKTDAFDPVAAAPLRKHGDRMWWYVCTEPKAPYAGLFIDHAPPGMRVLFWQSFQHDIEGVLVWDTTYWTSPEAYPDGLQNPYKDPMSWMTSYGTKPGEKLPWGNGDGRLLYPPLQVFDPEHKGPVLDPPVDSIRWEHIRDGIEDYEYLVILRELLKKHDAPHLAELIEVPPEISKSMTDFARDGAPIEARRHGIALAIEALSFSEQPVTRQ